MLRNYLTVAIRNLMRHKTYSVINTLGLSVGMACGILILLFIQDEFKHASYHPNGHRIFKVWREIKHPAGKSVFKEWHEGKIALAMRDQFPEIQVVARANASHFTEQWIQVEHKMRREFFVIVDSEFLEAFHYPMVSGDLSAALAQPGSVLITEGAAKRFFGDEDPIGRIVTNVKYDMDFRITGVMRDIPRYAHLRFDFLTFPHHPQASERFRRSWDHSNKIYLMLPEGHSHLKLESKLRDFYAQHMDEDVAGENILRLRPVSREYLYGLSGGQPRIGQIHQLALFGVAVLLIACINFMNLATARSADRAKEVGMRKAVGAFRRQLIVQFQGESILLSLIALVFAYGLTKLMLPTFNTLVTRQQSFPMNLTLEATSQGMMFLSLVGLALIVGIIAGSYPAFFLSAFQPVETLKGTIRTGTRRIGFRKGLIIFQFTVSICLILSTLVIDQQMEFIRNRDLGFDQDYIVRTPILNQDPSLLNQYEAVKRSFLQHPNILKMSASQRVPVEVKDVSTVYLEGDPNNERNVVVFGIDEHFLDTFGMELVEGRNLDLRTASDSTEAFLLNELAVKQFGWPEPIDKSITYRGRKGRVVGIVKDFHYRSLHHPVGPAMLLYHRPSHGFSFRISPNSVQETMTFLRNTWSKWIPHQPPRFNFVDRMIALSYREEVRLNRVLNLVSGLAILVACLGLFGLASFTVTQRTKEIGIRKVLGASIPDLIFLLSKDFMTLIIIANIIAWPVVYYTMNAWLQDFVYRIQLGIWPFLLGGVLSLVIALMTVSSQTVRAAISNPVDALRYE